MSDDSPLKRMARQMAEQEKIIADAKAKKDRAQKREDNIEHIKSQIVEMKEDVEKTTTTLRAAADAMKKSPLTDIGMAYRDMKISAGTEPTIMSVDGKRFSLAALAANGTINATNIKYVKNTSQREVVTLTSTTPGDKVEVLNAMDRVMKRVQEQGEVLGEITYEVVITAKANVR